MYNYRVPRVTALEQEVQVPHAFRSQRQQVFRVFGRRVQMKQLQQSRHDRAGIVIVVLRQVLVAEPARAGRILSCLHQ
jgi:hypothetical protein